MKGKKQNAFWPDVSTREGAESACKMGAGVAFFIAGVTALFAVLGGAGVEFVREMGIDLWAFVDVALFAACGWGMLRFSRAAAVFGAVLFVLERIAMATSGAGGIVVAIFFFLGLLGAVRGSFALARMAKEQPVAAPGIGLEPTAAPEPTRRMYDPVAGS